MSVMRKGWTETTLGDIAQWQGGITPSMANNDFWESGTIPWISSGDVLQLSLRGAQKYVTESSLKKTSLKLLPVGTVVVVVRSGILIHTLPIAILESPSTINQDIKAGVPHSYVLGQFLLWNLRSNSRVILESCRKTGTTVQSISTDAFLKFPVLLPPLAEQKRIVDIVSSVDAYIDALQQQAEVARAARNAVLHELLSAGGDGWTETTLDELVLSGVVTLGRGNVISKKDMEADPGPYPVYSSAQNNDGRIGSYNKFMFDEELITWSVDGGGYVFYRPHHKFSVTNIGGYLRILDGTKFLYPFLAAVLQKLHGQHVFDWQNKAHPSVIRKLYNNIPLASINEQKQTIGIVSSMDEVIEATEQAVAEAKNLRSGLLSDLLSGEHEVPESYDRLLGAA